MEAFVYWTLGVILLYGVIAQVLDSYTSFTHDEAWWWPLCAGMILIITLAIVIYTVVAGIMIAINICIALYYRLSLRWSLWRQKRAYLKRSFKVKV